MKGQKGVGMACLVTGGAGFIGSHVVDRLLDEKNQVIVYDNLSTGKEEFLEKHKRDINFKFINGDLLDFDHLCHIMKSADIVFHLAAHADVRGGTQDTRVDLEQNTIATWNVLESMRRNNVKKIVFTSTGSIYGEPDCFPTPEDHHLIQTSMYGASKLACEGMIEAFCEAFHFHAWIFRFVSVLGERYTHGCVFDFYKKLLQNPSGLYILGNGKQNKSYIYVGDCIEAMFQAIHKSNDRINIFNIGRDDQITVDEIVDIILAHLHLESVTRTYSGGLRGWVGDSPNILLDITKMKKLGVEPKTSIKDAIIRTLEYLKENKHLLERE